MDLDKCFENIGREMRKLKRVIEENELKLSKPFLSNENALDVYFDVSDEICNKEIDDFVFENFFDNKSELDLQYELFKNDSLEFDTILEFEIFIDDIKKSEEKFPLFYEKFKSEFIPNDVDIDDLISNSEEYETNIKLIMTYFENIIKSYIDQLINNINDEEYQLNINKIVSYIDDNNEENTSITIEYEFSVEKINNEDENNNEDKYENGEYENDEYENDEYENSEYENGEDENNNEYEI